MRRTIVQSMQLRKGFSLPQFNLQHRWFYVNYQRYPLMRKPLMRKLLAAFLANPLRPLTKDQLMELVHGEMSVSKSDRYHRVMKANLNKLMSRTRRELDQCFNEERRWIEFLVYEPRIKSWSFYRLRNDFISSESFSRKVA